MYTHCRSLLGFVPKLKVLTTSSLVQVSSKHMHMHCRNSSEAESEDLKGYLAMYPTILSELKTNDRRPKHFPCYAERIKEYIDYNMKNLAAIYALCFMESYRGFAAVPPSQEDIRLAYIMVWCINILRTTIIVMDDVFDKTPERRNRPCWYRVGDNDEEITFNDSIVVSYYAYQLLDKHFGDKFYYKDVIDTMNYMMYKTLNGQYLDYQISKTFKKTRNLDVFTLDGLNEMIEYKTIPCAWYPPIWISMVMNDITSPEIRRKVPETANQMAQFYQYLDDYIDCYSTNEGKKLYDDIENGQITWLISVALELANPQQRSILKECYGETDKDKVDAVVRVYNELGLKSRFQQFFKKRKPELEKKIEQLPESVPKHVFTNIMENVYCTQIKLD